MSVETIRYAGQPTTISLYLHVLFILLCFITLNGIIGRIKPKWRFTPAELLTTYFFVLMAAVMASHDMVEVLVPILSYPFRFGNAANHWNTEITPYIPTWLTIRDPSALEKYYVGNASLWNVRDLSIWIKPTLIWTGFFTVITFGCACLNVLFRKQWTDRERLSYPLAQLPLELVQPRVPLFSNKLFWFAFAITAILDTWFGLHTLFPSIPEPYTRWQTINQLLTSPPWNAIGWLPLGFFPWIVGVGMLLPLDFLFSCWFFFWIWKLQPIAASAYGYTDIPRFPFIYEQSFGAYLAIACFTIYTARKALQQALRSVWHGSDGTDKDEPTSYRFAVLGFVGSFLALTLFFKATGMTTWVVLVVLLFYFMAILSITRLRAELGTPAHDLGSMGPMRLMPMLFGTQNLSHTDLAMFAPMHGFNRNYRAHPMPAHIEGLRAAEKTGLSMKAMFWVLLIGASWGTFSGFLTNIHLHYVWGATSKVDPPYVSTIFGREPYEHISNLLTVGVPPAQNHMAVLAIFVGFIVTIILSGLRMNFVNFALHPVGYAVSSNWSMNNLWFSLMAAWFCKVVIFKYGGLKGYYRALPFFLGLILGECAIGSIWMLISIFTGTKTFIVWPYG